MPNIQITTTDGATLFFELVDRARIGRAADNDFVVPDGSVSSYHGELLARGDDVEINDLGSTNGTHVDGQRVENAVISPGQTFRIGSCPVLVVGEGAQEEAPASEQEIEDAPAPTPAPASRARRSAAPASELQGDLASTPCPTNLRQGFGPKRKEKGSSSGGGGLMVLGVLGLAACAAAAFMILQMSA